jgi:hypothetical protein
VCDGRVRRSPSPVDRKGPRSVEARLPVARSVPQPLPIDLFFVMDSTGSMGEEGQDLKVGL